MQAKRLGEFLGQADLATTVNHAIEKDFEKVVAWQEDGEPPMLTNLKWL